MFEEDRKFEARLVKQKTYLQKLSKEITEMKQQNITL